MLTNLTKLELFIAGKVYNFLCHQDSPLLDVKEALFQFTKYVGQVEDNIKAAQTQQPVAPAPDVSTPPVESEKVLPAADQNKDEVK